MKQRSRSRRWSAPLGGLALASLALAPVLWPALAQPNQADSGVAPPLQGAAEGDAAAVELLQLRDGRFLWAELLGASDEALSLRRLDQGGLVELPWSHLSPPLERALRLRFGLLDIESAELTTTAQRLTLVDGTDVIGLVVERSPELVHIKTAGSVLVVPTSRLSTSIVNVEVPAREIYTREELYQDQRSALAERLSRVDGDGAEAHGELALFCERILDFTRALEHWTRAAELGLVRDDLAERLAQAQRKAEVQAQVDLLGEVDLFRARGKYAEALAGLVSFRARFPQSPLLEDAAKLGTRVERDQRRALEREVVSRWHHWLGRLVRDAAVSKGYQESMNWLEKGLQEELVAKVTADLAKISPEIGAAEVRSLWSARKRTRAYSATYGLGTWLLGPDEARAGAPTSEAAQPAEGERDAARAELEDRVRRYLQNQQQQARSSNQNRAEQEDPEDVWRQLGSAARAQWLLARYVETSGDMQRERVAFSSCRECGGPGVIEVLSGGGTSGGGRNSASGGSGQSGSRLVPCPLCRQVGVVRRVHYW